MDALRAQSAGSPVGSHVAYKQLCCLPNGNGPAIMVALCARFVGSPVGSHSTYKQLRCLLYGADLQLWTRCARILLARRSARTAPTNSSAVCFTVLSRGANIIINELLTQDTRRCSYCVEAIMKRAKRWCSRDDDPVSAKAEEHQSRIEDKCSYCSVEERRGDAES